HLAGRLAHPVRFDQLPQPQRALRLLARFRLPRRILAPLLLELRLAQRERLAPLPLLVGERLLLLLDRPLRLCGLALRFLGLLLRDQACLEQLVAQVLHGAYSTPLCEWCSSSSPEACPRRPRAASRCSTWPSPEGTTSRR